MFGAIKVAPPRATWGNLGGMAAAVRPSCACVYASPSVGGEGFSTIRAFTHGLFGALLPWFPRRPALQARTFNDLSCAQAPMMMQMMMGKGGGGGGAPACPPACLQAGPATF